jgi:hypothetical protein
MVTTTCGRNICPAGGNQINQGIGHMRQMALVFNNGHQIFIINFFLFIRQVFKTDKSFI